MLNIIGTPPAEGAPPAEGEKFTLEVFILTT